MASEGTRVPEPPEGAVAIAVLSDGGWAYRGKRGCDHIMCSRDGHPDRCYGWHCGDCHGPSNCQADCRACRPCRPAPADTQGDER